MAGVFHTVAGYSIRLTNRKRTHLENGKNKGYARTGEFPRAVRAILLVSGFRPALIEERLVRHHANTDWFRQTVRGATR